MVDTSMRLTFWQQAVREAKQEAMRSLIQKFGTEMEQLEMFNNKQTTNSKVDEASPVGLLPSVGVKMRQVEGVSYV